MVKMTEVDRRMTFFSAGDFSIGVLCGALTISGVRQGIELASDQWYDVGFEIWPPNSLHPDELDMGIFVSGSGSFILM